MNAATIVDAEKRLVGIVTVDDAIDVLVEETSEDFEKMAAMSPTEDSYFKTSVFQHAKNRIIWLLVLMVSSIFTGLIITNYENAFAAVPILVAFIPMLMDTGGNCGSQSSTLIIRGLATDEIKPKDFLKAMWKEFRVSILVGLILAIFTASAFAPPICPESTGIAYYPSSSHTTTAGSLSLPFKNGAQARTAMPAAPIKTSASAFSKAFCVQSFSFSSFLIYISASRSLCESLPQSVRPLSVKYAI